MTEQALPAGWAWTMLGDVVLPVGKTDPASFERPQFKYIDISAVDGDTQLLNDVPSVAVGSAPSRARQLVRAGDTVFSTVRPYLRKIAWLPEHLDGEIASTGFCVLRPSSVIDSRFLYFAVTRQDFLDEVITKQRGVSYPAVRPAEVLEIPIPLPPLPEQHRIVQALEDHLSRLDAGEQILSSISRRTDALTAKLLDDTVLGATANQPLTSGPPTNLKGRHDRFRYRDLPALPKDWTWQLASDSCISINSGSTPKAELMQQDQGEIPFLKVYNIDPAGHIDFTKNPTFVSRDTHRSQLKRSIALPGDVVTNIVGPPLGKSAVVPDTYPEWNTNQAIVAFRAGDTIQSDWLAACLRSPFIVNLLKSTARATAGQFNIALSTCRELPLPVPPLRVQNGLLEELEAARLSLRHASSIQLTAQQRSTALRRSLLRAAFNGELIDQDPTDEPAVVSLAKIREKQSGTAPRRRRKVVAAK